jgi:lysophospholipase L1-like esterase
VVAALALAALGVLGAARGAPRPTLWLVGDSTMATRADTTRTWERGWGQLLPRFLDTTRVAVRNHAANGRSTRSFRAEGRWQAVLDSVRRGDRVLVQFGHNDQKQEDSTRFTNPYTGYRRNLERFVDEARGRGASPVLLTPIARRKFNAQGTLEDTHGAYTLVVREVARDRKVPMIDLQLLTEELVAQAGPERSKEYFVWAPPGATPLYPEGRQDDTHLNAAGATAVARLAARALRDAGVLTGRWVVGVD